MTLRDKKFVSRSVTKLLRSPSFRGCCRGLEKQLIWPVRGFKSMKTAYATIKGFEVMRALRKGKAAIFNLTRDIRGEARLVERAFGLGACALTEAVQLLGERLEAEMSASRICAGSSRATARNLQQSRLESGISLREKLFSRGECVGIERRGHTRLDRTRHPRPGGSQRSLRPMQPRSRCFGCSKTAGLFGCIEDEESVSRALRSADSSAMMAVARSPELDAEDQKPKRQTLSQLKRLRNIVQNPTVAVVVDRYSEDWSLLGGSWCGTREIVTEGTEHDQAQALLHSGIRNSTRCRSHLSRSSALSGRRTGAICPWGRVSEPAPSSTTR